MVNYKGGLDVTVWCDECGHEIKDNRFICHDCFSTDISELQEQIASMKESIDSLENLINDLEKYKEIIKNDPDAEKIRAKLVVDTL